MRRAAIAVTALAAMAACASLGWHRGASPIFALAFMVCLPVFAACWWSLVAERHARLRLTEAPKRRSRVEAARSVA